MVNIKDIPKHVLLQALFNGSFQQGLGALDPNGRLGMLEDEAKTVIERSTRIYKDPKNPDADTTRIAYFDYLHGRVLKVDINGDEVEERLYDRDNGQGALASIVDQIRHKYPILSA